MEPYQERMGGDNLKPPRAWIKEHIVNPFSKRPRQIEEVVSIDWEHRQVRIKYLGFLFSFDEVVLLWPTGLPDKNGKEGYYKDICRFEDDANQKHIGTIEWIGSGWYLVSKDNDDEGNYQFELSSREFEVIGDIFQNKELLCQ